MSPSLSLKEKASVLKFFSDFIHIPSVSTDASHAPDIQHASKFLHEKLRSLGFTVKLLKHGDRPPFVLAYRKGNSSRVKTIGVYGHYDVQPEDPIKDWNTPPFVLTRKDEKFFGRGTADDKGHVTIAIAAAERCIRDQALANTLVFFFEGEEESGGADNFEWYIQKAKKIIPSLDLVLVLDSGMKKRNVPQMYYGLRGIVYFELTIRIGERDLHSGVYGNKVLNPLQVLSELFSSIKDPQTRRVTIPGFYEDVRKLSLEEMSELKKHARTEKEELSNGQVYATCTIGDLPPTLAPKTMPSFDLHGICGGYVHEGTKTVIPNTASAKFSFRLVEHQSPEKVNKLVDRYIQKHLPKGVKSTLHIHESCPPFYADYAHPLLQHIAEILKTTFKNEVVYNRSGGSVPAAEVFQRLYKAPITLIGFTLPDENLHSPNENFDEEMFWKGIGAMERIFRN
ncbi:MAG TPA: M20/M25/M40 family metallo-hydrolase [Patescibacteria group bacterium]|nr:M20/M25/M40 family metallo-hydrolase [Patescibacteria group bacterium]